MSSHNNKWGQYIFNASRRLSQRGPASIKYILSPFIDFRQEVLP